MPALARETIDRLKLVSTATLTTQLFKRGLRNAFMQGVRPLGRYHGNLVGPAFTLRNIPAREDVDNVGVFSNPEHPQRKAIEITPEGHVLVIDCRGDTRAACAGEILVTRLMMRGVAGLVGDGGIRDAGPIGDMAQFPVFCAGPSAPLNLAQHHAVESNVPIGCGGVAVYPDDVIVGDRDGVAVIPRAMADEVAHDAAEQEELEEFLLQRVAGGAALAGTYPPNDATRSAFETWRKARQR
ncbi:MAG TPA: ribonuclease activity regulator RraA [Acetobacteraceae bacterium]|jgi:regulator of RNase E activity RraA|nr:ribonuclease activity regulator RraA [Acetobacteraceae bacterium]